MFVFVPFTSLPICTGFITLYILLISADSMTLLKTQHLRGVVSNNVYVSACNISTVRGGI